MTMLVACHSQTQWKHEQLVSGTKGAEGSEHTHFVNSQGIPCYTTIATGGYRDAWKYKTNLNFKYLGPNSNGYTFGINDLGQVAWEGGTKDSISVNVDGHDFYGPLFPPDPTQNRVVIRGLDDSGRPFWFWRKTGPVRGFLGDNEISGGKPLYDPFLFGVNGKGDTLFRAYDDSIDATPVFLNGVDISTGILGAHGITDKSVLSQTGDVLWEGMGPNTNGIKDLFFNQQSVTAGMFPNMKGGRPEGINNHNDFIWIRTDVDNTDHMMKGMKDISAPFGSDIQGIPQNFNYINDEGDVFWGAASKTLGHIAILNGKNISTDLLGIPTDFGTIGLDRFGNGVWYGLGPKMPVRSVFDNQFNLSKDAYGGFNYLASRALAVGVNGQVLWESEDMDGTASVWLSSPVPEPAIPVAGLIAGFALLVRRWPRH